MRVYKTKGEEKKTTHIVVPIPVYVMEKLEKKAEQASVTKTELARRFILGGLELKHG